MTETILDLGQFFFGFVAVVAAFIAGMTVGRDKHRGNLRPIDRREFDEQRWLREPPPWPLGGSVGEKPPQTIVHLYAPWKK